MHCFKYWGNKFQNLIAFTMNCFWYKFKFYGMWGKQNYY